MTQTTTPIINTRDRRSRYAYDELTRRQLLPLHFTIAHPAQVLWEQLHERLGDATQWLPDYEQVAEWLADNHCKGLLLTGGTGVGKSVIATEILPYIINTIYDRNMHVYRSIDLADRTKLLKMCDYPFPVLDDIGIEAEVNDYGTRQYALCPIVDHAEVGHHFLVVTTNLNMDDIIARYGTRTADRLQHLCHVVNINSPSLRR